MISLLDILTDHGTREYQVPIEMEQMQMQGETYAVREKEPLKLRISCPDHDHLLIEGTGSITLGIPCARCLTEVPTVFNLNISHELNRKQFSGDSRESDEFPFVEDQQLDTEWLVRDEICTNWPYRVLCREDCKGLCSVCGANLNLGECSCTHDENLDPRMAAISDIFSKFKEVE